MQKMIEYEKVTTIIIPSRSFDFLLEKTVKKIRAIYPDIKIILILDKIDSDAVQNDKNIVILQSENYTMSSKRNQGVKEADTEYLAFIDSDAYPSKNWLETGINFLTDNKDYAAVTGNWYNQEDDDFEQQCVRIHRFIPLFSRKEFHNIINTEIKDHDVKEFAAANLLIRRDAYNNIGGMNPEIYLDEDIEFSKRLIENNYKIRFIPSFAVFHRESHIKQYIKKTYASGILYACGIRKNKYFLKSSLWHLYPFALALIFILTFIFFIIKNISLLWLLIPIAVGFILIFGECIIAASKYSKSKIKGTFILFYISVLFCFSYIVSLMVGLLNIKVNIRDLFKQY